uniref:Peptidyl-prolyl cis-trans isomerase n=1 Tax=Palpitomonas bilix TaxID=652834 RepID=A0A7S3GCA7_9EUKA|mmetsp:Transcript_42156/g.108574  ORF Transcript_42156/g.108574 Transcript_42156/m.108574 type:complete len:178 (+) Transcript_42156:225-758(+)
MPSTRVFLSVSIGGENVGKLVFELFDESVPKTAENFRKLCTGESGDGREGKPLHFKNTIFHRIEEGFMAQGGDVTKNDGTGGESALTLGRTFNDENFILKHDRRGTLSMANSGANTNKSQFFVTFAPTPWLDNKHVVFGRLIDGFDTLDKIEAEGTLSGKPKRKVEVEDCGVVPEEN